MKTTTGNINISFCVYCPNCGHYINDYYDTDWREDNICHGQEQYVDNEVVRCPECQEEFIIKEFIL